MKKTLLALALALILSSRLNADDSIFKTKEKDFDRSFTINAMPLVYGLLSATAEFKQSDNISFGPTIALGSIDNSDNKSSSAFFYLIGAQFIWYPAGTFKSGFQLGAELYYSHNGDDEDSYASFISNDFVMYDHGKTLALIPFIGYKHIFAKGLTLSAQFGIGIGHNNSLNTFVYDGKVLDIYRQQSERDYWKFNINLGWSL